MVWEDQAACFDDWLLETSWQSPQARVTWVGCAVNTRSTVWLRMVS